MRSKLFFKKVDFWERLTQNALANTISQNRVRKYKSILKFLPWFLSA